MSKRIRDYAAEYKRRIAKGLASGKTRQQARRGVKKYAQAKPVEKVRRGRAAPKAVKKVGYTHLTQRFHSLKAAEDFAATLPSASKSYIMGRGKFTNPSEYDQGEQGWAALTAFQSPERWNNPSVRGRAEAETDSVFGGSAKTFEVRWREYDS